MFRSLKPETSLGYVQIPKTLPHVLKFCTEISEISSGDYEYSVKFDYEYTVEKEEDYKTGNELYVVIVDPNTVEIKELEGCHYSQDEMKLINQLPLKRYIKLQEDIAFHIEQEMADTILENHFDKSTKYAD